MGTGNANGKWEWGMGMGMGNANGKWGMGTGNANGKWGMGTGNGNEEWERGMGIRGGVKRGINQSGFKTGNQGVSNGKSGGCQTEKQPKYVFKQGSSKQISATSSVRNAIQ